MLWLVGSPFLISRFCPVINASTCGEYMQPSWVMVTGVAGTCHVLSAGSPDLIHTKAFFMVPLLFTTTSCDFAGALWAAVHAGTADISKVFAAGGVPSKVTLPVMVAPLSMSGTAAPPAAGVA